MSFLFEFIKEIILLLLLFIMVFAIFFAFCEYRDRKVKKNLLEAVYSLRTDLFNEIHKYEENDKIEKSTYIEIVHYNINYYLDALEISSDYYQLLNKCVKIHATLAKINTFSTILYSYKERDMYKMISLDNEIRPLFYENFIMFLKLLNYKFPQKQYYKNHIETAQNKGNEKNFYLDIERAISNTNYR